MIDVFVVAVLAALIHLGAVINVLPGEGIKAFALSVVFTMLAANSLDSRMVWDHADASADSDADALADAGSDSDADSDPDADSAIDTSTDPEGAHAR